MGTLSASRDAVGNFRLFRGPLFPIPAALERFIVSRNHAEIRLELHCDWIDMRTAKHWAPKDTIA